MQAWQQKPGGLLATGGQDGNVYIYSMSDYVDAVPLLCVPLASAETPNEPVTQIVWGADNQLFTGYESGRASSACFTVILPPFSGSQHCISCRLGPEICAETGLQNVVYVITHHGARKGEGSVCCRHVLLLMTDLGESSKLLSKSQFMLAVDNFTAPIFRIDLN